FGGRVAHGGLTNTKRTAKKSLPGPVTYPQGGSAMKAVFVCALLTCVLAGFAFAAKPSAHFDDSLADKWTAELGARSDQAEAIRTEKDHIVSEAKPMYTEQKD